MKLVTFDTAYARLGNWPGRLGYQEGKLLFNLMLGLKTGDAAALVGAGFGRAAMLAGTAARNVDARVYAVEKWGSLDPAISHWFNKAVWLAGLTETITPVDPANSMFGGFTELALIFIANETGHTVEAGKFLGSLSPGGVMFDPYGSTSSDGLQPLPGMPGGWRKVEKIEEKAKETEGGNLI